MALDNGLFIAQTFHKRLAPREHALNYHVYYLSFPLSQMKTLSGKLLSLSRFNLYGFYERDHGDGTKPLETWIRDVLAEYRITEADGEVVLVTMPRILGYVFNPVSFWFCLDKAGNLRAVLSEVRNTFHEKHCYLSFHDDKHVITQDDWLESQKIFHVSPFLKVQGSYKFRFAYGDKQIGVWVDYYDNGQKMLMTSLIGKRLTLNDKALFVSFFRYPLLTLKVIMLIHFHALRLVLKGIKYHVKPTPPHQDISR